MKTVTVMKILLVLAVAAALMGVSWAGVTVTERPGNYELRARGSSALLAEFPTLAACVAAIKALPLETAKREYNCKGVTYVDAEPNCDDVAKPALTTFIVFFPDITYRLSPDEDQPPSGVRVLPNGVEYTFTDVGGLRAVQKPDGSWGSEEYKLVLQPFPACWAWTWVAVPEPPPPSTAGTWTPVLDPGALDGEKP